MSQSFERRDGRSADELRPIQFRTDYIEYPEGSVLVETGRTKVLCNATVEPGVPSWMARSGKRGGWVTAEYAMLPRSTHERSRREGLRPRGRTQEIRRLIGRSLGAAVRLEALDEITVTIDCDVLQADGGTRTASITGGYVALALALGRQVEAGQLAAEALRAPVAAVSAGLVASQALLDLAYDEDVRAQVDANIVMDGAGRFIEVQAAAEGEPIDRSELEGLIGLAEGGIRQLVFHQRQALERHGITAPADSASQG